MLETVFTAMKEFGPWVALLFVFLGVSLFVLTRFLDMRFKVLESRLFKHGEQEARVSETVALSELAVYPALSKLVYQAKCAVDGLAKADSIFELRPPDLVDAASELTTNLWRYRIYLSKDVFEDLHLFKHLTQDLLIRVDTATRPSVAVQRGSTVSPELQQEIEKASGEIRRVNERIQESLRIHMRALAGRD